MPKERIVLRFPAESIEQPVTTKLVRDYDLWINILRASVDPGEEGRLLLELDGAASNLEAAKDYVRGLGIRVQPVEDKLSIDRDRCCDCGACTAVCVSRSLCMDSDDKLSFDSARCMLCLLCVPACPMRALSATF